MPASTRRRWQEARNTGRQSREASMFVWSMLREGRVARRGVVWYFHARELPSLPPLTPRSDRHSPVLVNPTNRLALVLSLELGAPPLQLAPCAVRHARTAHASMLSACPCCATRDQIPLALARAVAWRRHRKHRPWKTPVLVGERSPRGTQNRRSYEGFI